MVSDSGSDYAGGGAEESLRAGLAASRLRAVMALLIGAGFLGWTLVDGMSAYRQLPDRIPIHFGPSGSPDRWAAKGIFPVFAFLIGGAALLVMMAFVSRLGAKWYNFPGKERVLKLPPAHQAYVIAPLQEVIAWLGAVIAVAFSIGSRQAWAVAAGERSGLSAWVMLSPAAVVVVGAVAAVIAARVRLRAIEEPS